MGLTWAALNPRKVLKLFRRPKHDQHARQRQHLFPLVPPASSNSTIVDRLILRAHGTAAKPVLCTHTVTVTATSDVAIPEYPTTAQDKILQPAETAKDTTKKLVLPANNHVQVADDIDAPLSPISSISMIEAPIEVELDGGVLETVKGDDQIEVQNGRVLESTRSVDSAQVSRPKEVASTPVTTKSVGSSKDDKQVDILSPPLSGDRGYNVSKEQETEHRSSLTEDDDEEEEEEEEEEEDDDYIDPEVLRADWVPLEAIPEDLFRAILLQHLPGKAISMEHIHYTDGVRGGNSIVRFLEVDDGPFVERYIIKIPSVGTAARWQDSDAYMLRNDARTMMYIRKHTDMPCPEVIGFDDSLNNILGTPYTVMRANKGISSNKIWFDQDEYGEDDETNAGLPDEARVQIRMNFLRSLAACMAKLQTLEFDCAGTLNFDDDAETPTIGPTFHWKDTDEMVRLSIQDLSTPKSIERIPVHQTSKSYFMDPLNKDWPHREDISGQINNGRRFIMQTMLSNPPFSQSEKAGDRKETFVLRHDDLDFQNILCDEKGNVTGIIDWDKCRAAPRCIGFASLPAFLVKDWAPDYKTLYATHLPWDLTEYRNIYAYAMLKATGPSGDGKYTINSAIYEAANAALYGGHNGGGVGNFVRRMLKSLATTRMFDDMDVLSALGQGWDIGECKVGAEIARFIEPQSHVKAVEPWFWVNPDDEL